MASAAAAAANESNKSGTASLIDAKVFSGSSFEEGVRAVLASGVTQPILKLNTAKDATPEESIELMLDVLQLLRDQYITKHDKVRQMIEKRVKIQRILEEQQRQEVADLMLEKVNLREKAETLADKYEELNERQQTISKNLHELLRAVNERCPNAAPGERDFIEKVNKIDVVTRELTKKIAAAKQKLGKQQFYKQSVANSTTASPRKQFLLQPKQENALKEVIAENTAELNTQINEIKEIKKRLNIE